MEFFVQTSENLSLYLASPINRSMSSFVDIQWWKESVVYDLPSKLYQLLSTLYDLHATIYTLWSTL